MNIADCSRQYHYGNMAYWNQYAMHGRNADMKAYQPLPEEDSPGADRAQAGVSVQDAYEKMSNPVRLPAAVSEEGREWETEQESETKSEIIVKPDGSKVLVMTMSVGGMQTRMSLEISRPTNMLDDHAALEDNGEDTADAQGEAAAEGDLASEGGV